MKSIEIFVKLKNKCNYVSTYNLNDNYTKNEIIENIPLFEQWAREDAKGEIERIEVLLPMKSKYEKNKLINIGEFVASGWGAHCYDVKTYMRSVAFYCIENGEKFTTRLSYEELEKEYLEYL